MCSSDLENIFTTALSILDDIGDFVNLLMEGKFKEAFKVLEKIGDKVLTLIMDTITSGITLLKDIGQDVTTLVIDTIESGLDVLSGIGQKIYDYIMSLVKKTQPPRKEKREMAVMLGETPITTGTFDIGGTKYGTPIDEDQDFISRPGQKNQPFSSQDTIIGMKDLSGLLKGAGGVTVDYRPVYHIDALTDRDDLRRLLEEHDEELKREIQSAISYPTNLRG